jgi:hypothetical protein
MRRLLRSTAIPEDELRRVVDAVMALVEPVIEDKDAVAESLRNKNELRSVSLTRWWLSPNPPSDTDAVAERLRAWLQPEGWFVTNK